MLFALTQAEWQYHKNVPDKGLDPEMLLHTDCGCPYVPNSEDHLGSKHQQWARRMKLCLARLHEHPNDNKGPLMIQDLVSVMAPMSKYEFSVKINNFPTGHMLWTQSLCSDCLLFRHIRADERLTWEESHQNWDAAWTQPYLAWPPCYCQALHHRSARWQQLVSV